MSETKVIKKFVSPHKITLYRNGDNPNIYYYFTFKKKSYRGSTGESNLKLSTDKVFEIFYEVKTGKKKILPRGSTKFKEVCKKYLKYKDNDIKKELSTRTLSDYKRQSEFLIEKFGNDNIESLCSVNRYEEYQRWRKNYYKEHPSKIVNLKGRQLSQVGNVPINREVRLLVSILRYAKYQLSLLPDIEIPPYTILFENYGKKILDDAEYERLRDFMSVNRPYQWLVVSFINSTGIRYPSELLKITWKDVDWETPCVWIRNRKNPKGGKSVDTPFPLLGTGLEVIKSLWSRENISKGPNDPVFVNDKGKQVKNIRKSFKYCLNKCEIDNSICLYSFRHRFTTRMVLHNTVPVVVLSKILGHKTTDMVMKVYEQTDKDHYLKALQDGREEYYKKKKARKSKYNGKEEYENNEQPSYLDLYDQA